MSLVNSDQAYRPSGPHIIYENIDGELILLNINKGFYYSTDAVGVQLWEMLVAGHRVKDMRATLCAGCAADRDATAKAVDKFIDALQVEELIVPDDGARHGRPIAPQAAAPELPFQPPVLHRYTDMEGLIMLDPIHQVDDAGWPTRNADGSANAPGSAPGPAD